MQKNHLLCLIILLCWKMTFAQQANSAFDSKETARIINFLASDELRGRKIYTPEIDKAADFIATEFKKAGLLPLPPLNNYLQSFSTYSASLQSLSAEINGGPFPTDKVFVLPAVEKLNITQSTGYDTASINMGDNFFNKAYEYSMSNKNLVIKVDESFKDNFKRLIYFKRNYPEKKYSQLFILTNSPIQKFAIKASHTIHENKLANVVGYLPGKSRKNEYVIFSSHYDHLGVGKPVNGDSIYNGANDDASGTTAVIELANYFKALGIPERSIIFVTFTAEESGGFGSSYFSRQLDPQKIIAMFNIEMIGTDSKWGKNSAYITGFEKSSFGKILQKNLQGSEFSFYPDPYPDQQLFYRSDNATLAKLGVPAHTISTSKMDAEPNYHQVSDEVKTLDLENMTKIIRSIALSAGTIVAGTDTPTRVAEAN